MPDRPVAPAAPIAPIRRNRAPVLAGVVGKMVLKEVRNQAEWNRCRLTHSPGKYERMAGADAINPARSVMSGALGAQSEVNAGALRRTLDLFGPDSVEPVGPVLVENLTTMGATRAGLEALMSEASRPDLAPLLAKLDASIVEIGVRAGKCKGIPDAVLRDKTSGKLCDAVAAGKKVMLECAGKVGARELLRGIAQSVLPRSIREAIQERLSSSADKFVGPISAERLMEVLQAQGVDKLEQRIVDNLENGGAESWNAAILNVLKTAECVIQGELGGAENAPPASKLPHDAPKWVRDETAKGSPILYNVVSNDGSATSHCARGCGMQLEHIRNLMNDAREDAYERGRLTEIVRFQEHHIDRLERELQAERERNGPGEVRARKLQNERLNNASVGTGPLDEELDSIPALDAGRYQANRRGAGVDQTDNSEHPPQGREHLSNASNNALPPDFDLGPINPNDRAWALLQNHTGGTDEIDRSGQQRQDQLHNPANGVIPPDGSLDRTPDQDNGGALVRRQLGGDDQTDRSDSRPLHDLLQRGANGVVAPGDDLGDVPPLKDAPDRASLQSDGTDHADSSSRHAHQQRLGGGQVLAPHQSERFDSGGAAPLDGAAVLGEFERYLQALGREQTPRPRDPLQPIGPRRMVQYGNGEPSILASDFAEYRDRRALASSDSFTPFSTGRVGTPVDAEKPELIKLIDKHGPGNLSPKHVLEHYKRRPAKATSVAIRSPDTTLDLAFASMRKKRMEALYSASTPTARAMPPRTLSAQPESSPAARSDLMGASASLRSLSNTMTSGDVRSPTRAEILADSRSPRGELQRQAGVDQGLQFARSTSRLGSGVAQIVKNSDPQPQSDVFAGRALSSSNLAPTPRNEELQQPGAFVKAEKDGTAPVPRSAHMVALEQAVQMLRLRRSAELVKTADDVSSDTYSVAPFERGVSEESQDSGNGSPARLNEGDWGTPVKRVGDVEPAHMQKYPRMRDLDLSFAENHHVEVSDASLDGPEEKVVHVEHHEHVVHAKRQGTIDQAPVTLWSTQPSLTAALRAPPSVHISKSADSMDALIQELTESFQKRAAAQAAT